MARPTVSIEDAKLHGMPKAKVERPSRAAAGESEVPAGRPKWGNLPRECRACFKRVCRMLQERRHLTPGDRELITVYAIAENRYWTFKAVLDREGWTILTDDGVKDHPVARHFYSAERTMLSCLDRLGLHPSAKDKPKPAPRPKEAPEPDAMDALLSREPKVLEFTVPEVEDEDVEENSEPTP